MCDKGYPSCEATRANVAGYQSRVGVTITKKGIGPRVQSMAGKADRGDSGREFQKEDEKTNVRPCGRIFGVSMVVEKCANQDRGQGKC